MNHVKHPLSPAGIDIFSSEICNFCYIKKYKYRLHFKTYFLIRSISLESLSVVLINLATILMMLGKLAALDFLIIKVFWNKGYDVIICVNDFTNKILLCDSNYVLDVVMWWKLLALSFLWGKLSWPQFLRIWSEKSIFWEVFLIQVQ